MIFRADLSHKENLEKIFWETSAIQNFSSDEQRLKFVNKYFNNYFFCEKAHNFFAQVDGQYLGYILSVENSNDAVQIMEPLSFLKKFQTYYQDFPAHLHINLTASSRNQGVGSKLISHLEQTLKSKGISGLHLMTSPDARNVGFYLKNNFQRIAEIDGILMLGKSL